ncbi:MULTISPECIES: winged helix-turn-helix domain-containing protein [Salinibaculum]|uniref:winged helix-turn-helix domain-containing protein n=1 Tax=Salinibaculum TaxID=2732368 RepID=UPI0030D30755
MSEDESPIASPEAAFMTLSNDLRLEILLALWDAPDFTLTFSELRKAVGERDSGTFTYHLGELQDHFIAETDDGYELQYPGHRVLDAIQSGVFHERETLGPVALDADCRDCGAGLSFEYGTDYIGRVRCHDCGNRVLEWPFDPGGIADRGPQEVVAAFDRRTRLVWSCALDGVCPFCAGRVERDIVDETTSEGLCIGVLEDLDRYDEYFATDHPAVVGVDCRQCSFYSFVPVGTVLLTRPAITGTLTTCGMNVRETPLWGLDFVVDGDAVEVAETTPLTVAVRATPPGGDTLVAHVDGALDVSLQQQS